MLVDICLSGFVVTLSSVGRCICWAGFNKSGLAVKDRFPGTRVLRRLPFFPATTCSYEDHAMIYVMG